jgi:hypothetical protein
MSILPQVSSPVRSIYRVHSAPPVRATRHTPRPGMPFGSGIDGPCGCSEQYTCLSCLERQHAERKAQVRLHERFGPTEVELRWNAENSPANAADFDVDDDADAELMTHAFWSQFCDPSASIDEELDPS